jgi:hypothetical protein
MEWPELEVKTTSSGKPTALTFTLTQAVPCHPRRTALSG